MASILKVDSLQELTANAGIHIVGKITGPSGDLITADGRLSVTRQNITVTDKLTAETVSANTYLNFMMNQIANLTNVDTANENQVLTADGLGGFRFSNPIETGAIGYSDAYFGYVDGGKPDSVFASELLNIDGGTVVQDHS